MLLNSYFKYFVDFREIQFSAAVELVDVDLFAVHEKQSEAHHLSHNICNCRTYMTRNLGACRHLLVAYFDELVLLARQQVHVVLVQRHGEVDDVAEEVFVSGNLLQTLLQHHTHLVLRRQEHGQVL